MQVDAEFGRQARRARGDNRRPRACSLKASSAVSLSRIDRAGHLGRLHVGRALGGRLAHQRLEIGRIAPGVRCRNASGRPQP